MNNLTPEAQAEALADATARKKAIENRAAGLAKGESIDSGNQDKDSQDDKTAENAAENDDKTETGAKAVGLRIHQNPTGASLEEQRAAKEAEQLAAEKKAKREAAAAEKAEKAAIKAKVPSPTEFAVRKKKP
jgi:hypothetical protein